MKALTILKEGLTEKEWNSVRKRLLKFLDRKNKIVKSINDDALRMLSVYLLFENSKQLILKHHAKCSLLSYIINVLTTIFRENCNKKIACFLGNGENTKFPSGNKRYPQFL
jgi:hypothetical protein